MKILNLFAGIGGNRKLWEGHEVTSVELDYAIYKVCKVLYPNDKVVNCDAKNFLEMHHKEYDFIWASPPCQSHGQYRHNVGVLGKGYQEIIPDMSLYGMIVFLQTYSKCLWVVENTEPYYIPLIKPTATLQRHLFWSNFPINNKEFEATNLRTKNKISDFEEELSSAVSSSLIENKRQVLRNCVDPDLGLYILQQAMSCHKSENKL